MIPTRQLNPFATCWVKPGALPYRFASGEDSETMIRRWLDSNREGQIVGPHGSGKSTLLALLVDRLRHVGHDDYCIILRDRQRRLPLRDIVCAVRRRNALVAVDGYELLCSWQRQLLKQLCRRWQAGLLVTAHGDVGLPLLSQTRPNLATVHELVADLTRGSALKLAADEVTASFRAHNGNVRETFFDLYDRYERNTRQFRTTPPAALPRS